MAKKRVAAIVKIQLPAGAGHARAAGRHRPRPARRADHGVLQAVQRGHREPAGQRHPRRDHDLRGPLVHLHPQDAADAGAAAQAAAGIEKGAATPGKETAGTVTDAQIDEIAQTKMPDLNANDLEAAKKQVAGTARSMGITVAAGTEDAMTSQEAKRYVDAAPPSSTAQATARAGRGRRPGQELRRPPSSTRPSSWPSARRRPPQGRPDRPGHRRAARRHRPERAGRGVRRRREGGRGPGGRRRHRRCRRPRRAGRRAASSTSTSPSPRPT